MASYVLLIGTTDFDLLSFAKEIRDSGAHQLTISQSNTSQPSITRRTESSVRNIEPGDTLYVVAHGNSDSWGSASASAVSVSAKKMIEFFANTLQKSVQVCLCICESWELGVTLKKIRPDLAIWAARGTPKLEWNAAKKEVQDSSGKYSKV